jgi:hypothetical protein
MVASITKFTGDLEKFMKWLNWLPEKYFLYELTDLREGDFVLWTEKNKLQILK